MILYKYFPPSRSNFFTQAPVLRYSPIVPFDTQGNKLATAILNDPFEGLPSVQTNLSYTDMLRLRSNVGGTEPIYDIPELRDEFNKFLRQEGYKHAQTAYRELGFGVLCLSKTFESILMWGHYAHSHEGFVVGFDISHPFFSARHDPNGVNYNPFKEVNYSAQRPVMDNLIPGQFSVESFVLTKSAVWAYEQEWRQVATGITSLNHNNCCGLVTVPCEAIQEIYLGLYSSDALAAEAKNFASTNNASVIKKADYHFDNFELIFNDY